MKKPVYAITFIVIFILSANVITEAVSYTYNSWNEPVKTPDAYIATEAVLGGSFGVNRFVAPTDMVVSSMNELYILDPGTNSIIVLDENLSFLRSIWKFTKNGKLSPLSKDANGIFVDENENIFIADYSNERAFVCNQSGEIIQEFVCPTSPLYPSDVKFLPSKILRDTSGNVYILIDGLYYGAIIYDINGEFQGFYGSNKVEVDASVLVDYFWKKIMTKEQKKQLARYVPIEYTNMFINDKNFIYTCTKNAFRKLNPGGKDVLRADPNTFFGDYYVVWDHGKPIQTIFSDVVVEKSGIVSLIDRTRGKIFQYSPDSDLLFAFGGNSNQLGTFKMPIAIESLNGKLLVLDSKKCSITTFEPTKFGQQVRQAIEYHSIGKYEEAQGPWHQVLNADANYELAYIGIGKSQYNLGQFKEAMASFKLGNDRNNYSIAKKEYRAEQSQENFAATATITILLIIIALFLLKSATIKKSILSKRSKHHVKGSL